MFSDAMEERTLVHFLAKRFGRRGLILIAVGFGFALFGAVMLILPQKDRFSRPGPSPLDWADSKYWGYVWLGCGTIALLVGLQRRRAPDVIGYTAAFIPPAIWTFLYIYSAMVWFATGGEFGEPFTWASAFIWADFMFLIRICAGWDDPSDPILITKGPI
jgi:hypothetical protein